MERVRQITRVNEAHKLGYIGNNVTVAVMQELELILILDKESEDFLIM